CVACLLHEAVRGGGPAVLVRVAQVDPQQGLFALQSHRAPLPVGNALRGVPAVTERHGGRSLQMCITAAPAGCRGAPPPTPGRRCRTGTSAPAGRRRRATGRATRTRTWRRWCTPR